MTYGLGRQSFACDFLDQKDWTRAARLQLLRAGIKKDLGRVADALLNRDLLLLGLLLELHVEEPLVDLDARQSCLAHGLLPDLAVPFTAQLFEKCPQVFHLLVCLFLAANVVLDHSRWRAWFLLALALAGDPGLRRYRLLRAELVVAGHRNRLEACDHIQSLLLLGVLNRVQTVNQRESIFHLAIVLNGLGQIAAQRLNLVRETLVAAELLVRQIVGAIGASKAGHAGLTWEPLTTWVQKVHVIVKCVIVHEAADLESRSTAR